MMLVGPQNVVADQKHAEKYRGEGETFREASNRWASALSDDSDHFMALRDCLLPMKFMPAGRIQSAVGSTRCVTPYNCFVSGTIDDSFVEGGSSIMARATEAAATMRKGGGIGYDFSTLRPSGALIKKLNSHSSGPIPFMKIFDSVGQCVASAGHRRGAQMGVLRVDHPDIEQFVRMKQKKGVMEGFNVSVGVTDEFMIAVRNGTTFDLRFQGQVYNTIDARTLWETIMRSTWDWGEPGVLFIDRINQMNNLHYCEVIAATNPCGEQPLPPFGACLLGSFNLVKYVRGASPVTRDVPQFDYDALCKDIPIIVRAMDNVIDIATYPLREQEIEAKHKRRMGIGETGVANAIEAVLGRACYGEPEFVEFYENISWMITVGCYRASVELAKEKGAFPGFDAHEYCNSKFIQTLPEDLQDDIQEYGIRNSHLRSIAPTGTISFCADNISSSIEPVFSYEQERDLITPDGKQTVIVRDYGVDRMGIRGKQSHEVTVDEHLAVLAAATRCVDSAVSKTCNVSSDMAWEDFKGVYSKAFDMGCKGITTFNPDGKRFAVLRNAQTQESDTAVKTGCELDPVNGRRSCD